MECCELFGMCRENTLLRDQQQLIQPPLPQCYPTDLFAAVAALVSPSLRSPRLYTISSPATLVGQLTRSGRRIEAAALLWRLHGRPLAMYSAAASLKLLEEVMATGGMVTEDASPPLPGQTAIHDEGPTPLHMSDNAFVPDFLRQTLPELSS